MRRARGLGFSAEVVDRAKELLYDYAPAEVARILEREESAEVPSDDTLARARSTSTLAFALVNSSCGSPMMAPASVRMKCRREWAGGTWKRAHKRSAERA